jgi:glutathione S-transferase
MKLYGALASPYVARVVMFANLKGIDLPMESAPGGMGSDEYRLINPTGKIPSLETDGHCIAESEVICEYLECIHPEPRLIPADPIGRAQALMISRMTDLYVAPHNTPLRSHKDPAHRDQAVVDRQAAEFAKGFSYLASFMGPGPFAVADQPTIGDCALAPFIGMLKQTVFPFFTEIADPTIGDGRLAVWWNALQGHPVCKQSVDDYEEALEIFLKWLRDLMAKREQQSG